MKAKVLNYALNVSCFTFLVFPADSWQVGFVQLILGTLGCSEQTMGSTGLRIQARQEQRAWGKIKQEGSRAVLVRILSPAEGMAALGQLFITIKKQTG